MPASPIDSFRTAASSMDTVVAGIGADQWSESTPCTEWTVADVTDHVIAGNRLFASALRADRTPPSPPDEEDGGHDVAGTVDRLAAYRRSIDELHEAFAAAGALDRIVSVPFGQVPGVVALHLRVIELLVHGWDVARATDQRIEAPDEVVRGELEFSRQALSQIPPDRSPFGPPQPVAEGASALDELTALLGRTSDAR
jgi:uncharacterized protein (TIGR03086 family)